MQVEINKAKVKNMVALLRKEVAPNLRVCQAYEVVSRLLGFSNWDTLCGLLRKEEQNASAKPLLSKAQKQRAVSCDWRAEAPAVGQPFTMFVMADFTNTLSRDEVWVKIRVDQAFVDLLHSLQTRCLETDTAYIQVDYCPEEWGGYTTQRPQTSILTVDKKSFHLYGNAEQGPAAVRSLAISFEDFYALLEDNADTPDYMGWADGVLFVDVTSPREFALELLYKGVIDIEEGTIDEMRN